MTKVSIYALSTCPWCRKTKKFFNDHNIPFECVDYDLVGEDIQEKIMDEIKRHGVSISFPYVMIGEKIVVGYNPKKYSELMGV